MWFIHLLIGGVGLPQSFQRCKWQFSSPERRNSTGSQLLPLHVWCGWPWLLPGFTTNPNHSCATNFNWASPKERDQPQGTPSESKQTNWQMYPSPSSNSNSQLVHNAGKITTFHWKKPKSWKSHPLETTQKKQKQPNFLTEVFLRQELVGVAQICKQHRYQGGKELNT